LLTRRAKTYSSVGSVV